MAAVAPGKALPKISVKTVDGSTATIGAVKEGRWQMVVVYRGKHCPLCTKYLNSLEGLTSKLQDEMKVDVLAVSGDPIEKAQKQLEDAPNGKFTFPLGYDLSEEEMHKLGLFVSSPRTDVHETDKPFAEPGVFITNPSGILQVLEKSNAPFARPDLDNLIYGLQFVQGNNYPIRGLRA